MPPVVHDAAEDRRHQCALHHVLPTRETRRDQKTGAKHRWDKRPWADADHVGQQCRLRRREQDAHRGEKQRDQSHGGHAANALSVEELPLALDEAKGRVHGLPKWPTIWAQQFEGAAVDHAGAIQAVVALADACQRDAGEHATALPNAVRLGTHHPCGAVCNFYVLHWQPPVPHREQHHQGTCDAPETTHCRKVVDHWHAATICLDIRVQAGLAQQTPLAAGCRPMARRTALAFMHPSLRVRAPRAKFARLVNVRFVFEHAWWTLRLNVNGQRRVVAARENAPRLVASRDLV
mmetsp:Transcript_85598/g.261843  ORF Transcript_85598/g.261843 Transcript_85598/m.261843 type:complete len:292 (-) Transcript_85598:220-1095(-)